MEDSSKAVADWLANLGMEHFAQNFEDNGIDWDFLPDLSNDDLKDLGVSRLRDRKILLAAIADLAGDGENAAGQAAPVERGAERRQLTVMFCDLVGSTELSTQIDPEELRELLSAYQDVCRAAIKSFDGFIARYMGDGILVYFGYPRAREDSAECAVRAGLEVVASMASLNTQYRDRVDKQLAVRVGIATGPVVVGDIIGEGAAEEAAVIGEAPNLAARLQSFAQPDQVVVSETTRKLIGGLFELEDLGSHYLKGIAGEVTVTRVIRERETVTRFDARARADFAPLVGRQRELDQLQRAWASAREGCGRAVLIVGEAGIGKSRLAETAALDIGSEGRAVLRFQCSKFHINTQLYPLVHELHTLAGINSEDSSQLRLEKLQTLLSQNDAFESEVDPLHLLALFLSIPTEGHFPPLEISPTRRKTLLFQGILRALSNYSSDQPLAIIFEDAHWMDPTTLDLLTLAVDHLAGLNVLLIVTLRPEALPQWALKDMVDILRVPKLDSAAVYELVDNLGVAEGTAKEILEKADGVPLFIEELSRMVLERDDAGHAQASIPETIQDLLLTRLDQLGDVKKLAQLAACIGRRFQRSQLEYVAELPEDVFNQQFEQLVSSGMSLAADAERPDIYMFSHALAQEVAYDSLLRAKRAVFHERIALSMEKHQVEDFQLAELAHHFSQTQFHQKALEYWKLAGLHAVGSSAYVEASSHFINALEKLSALEGEAVAAQELELRVLAAAPMTLTRGWAHPDVGRYYERANELCGEEAESRLLFPILHGIFRYYLVTGQHATAKDIAVRDLTRAKESGNEGAYMEFLLHPGVLAFYTGNHNEALEYLQRCLAIHSAGNYQDHPEIYAGCPATIANSHIANALAILGQPRDAFMANEAAAKTAASSRHVFSQIWAISNFALNNILYDDHERCAELAREMVTRAQEQEFPNWQAQGMAWLGWSLARGGDVSSGLSTLTKGIEIWNQTGARLMTPFYYVLLADVQLMADDFEQAKDAVTQSLDIAAQTGECWSSPLARQLDVRIAQAAGDLPVEQAVAAMRELAREAADEDQWLWAVRAQYWILLTAIEAGVEIDRQPLRDVLGRFPGTEPYPLLRTVEDLLKN